MFKYFIGMMVALLISSPAASAAGEKWTMFIWMNGDNNLCSYAYKNKAQLKSLDVSNVANVIVAFDCNKKKDSELVEIRGKEEIKIQTGVEYDMGDSEFMVKMTKNVFETYPSEKKMFVIWNHGNGWKNAPLSESSRGVSYDDDSGHFITTEQLGTAMEKIGRVDLLGFDACLMQMIEIGYEVGSAGASYIVGSEEVEPGDGWDYSKIALSLSKEPETIELGKVIVDSFIALYPGDKEVTQSLVDVKKLEDFSLEFGKTFADYDKTKIKDAMAKAPYFYDSTYRDIRGFLSLLPDEDVSHLKDSFPVLYKKGRGEVGGLAIYYYTNPTSSKYFNLKFAKDTGWLRR